VTREPLVRPESNDDNGPRAAGDPNALTPTGPKDIPIEAFWTSRRASSIGDLDIGREIDSIHATGQK
jgi:hypothetical protein